jgi:hypothetical protein
MDDTHTPANGDDQTPEMTTSLDELAAMDPADAAGAAERLAAELAADLESVGGSAEKPVQLRADLGDGTGS